MRIFFDKSVSRFVRRRQWHASQRIRDVAGGVELTMTVSGVVELVSWVLSFGPTAVVLEPPSLSEQVGEAAHHIVAGSAPAAAPAREVLKRFGIGINDAANGVLLPGNLAAENVAGAAVHSTIHTDAYYSAINQMLDAATSREQALAILGAIRQALLKGGL